VVSKVRAAIVVVLIAGLLLSGYYGYRLVTEKPQHEPPVSRVTGTTDDGWQQVTYLGVDLEVPPDWERVDMAGCIGTTERWGPKGLDPCADDLGLWFLASATFDPATGPGVHTAPKSKNLPDGGWTGYVTRGDVVVDVTDPDQDVVRRILRSVSLQA
jgi:hypothetical protein